MRTSGPIRSRSTGSVSNLTPPDSIRTVAWPIHVIAVLTRGSERGPPGASSPDTDDDGNALTTNSSHARMQMDDRRRQQPELELDGAEARGPIYGEAVSWSPE